MTRPVARKESARSSESVQQPEVEKPSHTRRSSYVPDHLVPVRILQPAWKHARTHAHTRSHSRTYAHARTHARIYALTDVRTHARMHTRSRARTHVGMHTRTNARTYTHIHSILSLLSQHPPLYTSATRLLLCQLRE